MKTPHCTGVLENPVTTRTALTLIELIVAMALSAMLLTVLLGVTRRTLAVRDATMRRAGQIGDADRVRQQLQRDLQHADSMVVLDDGFSVIGNVFRDPASTTATHQPGMVRYRVGRSFAGDDSGWLFRDQYVTGLGGNGWQLAESQPVWRGIATIAISSDFIMDLSALTIDEPQFFGGQVDSSTRTMPPTIRVVVIRTDGAVLIDHNVFHHRES